jgi:hypothetical protein
MSAGSNFSVALNDAPFITLVCITITSFILVMTTTMDEVSIGKNESTTTLLPTILTPPPPPPIANEERDYYPSLFSSPESQPQKQEPSYFGGNKSKSKTKTKKNKKKRRLI